MSDYKLVLSVETREFLLTCFPPVYRHVFARGLTIDFADVELIKILGHVDNGETLQTLLIKVERKRFPTESLSTCIPWSGAVKLKEISERDLRRYAFYRPVKPMVFSTGSFTIEKIENREIEKEMDFLKLA